MSTNNHKMNTGFEKEYIAQTNHKKLKKKINTKHQKTLEHETTYAMLEEPNC